MFLKFVFKHLATLSLFTLLTSLSNTISFFNLTETSLAQTKLESNSKSASDEKPVNLPTKLKLTTDQKQKMKVSFRSMLQKVAAELTPEQRKKMGESVKSGEQVIPSLNSLNLTSDQTKKIKTVIRATNSEIKAMLTPEQLNELKLSQAQKAKK